MENDVIKLDIPADIMSVVLNDPSTIVLKIVPEKNSIEKLKENIQMSETKSFVLMAYCNITLQDVEAYEKGDADHVGNIIVNKKLEDYSEDYIKYATEAMEKE